MKYVIDLDKLHCGDIILVRTNGGACKKIRKACGSEYSHALIYKGDTSCLESNILGVRSVNPQRLLFDNHDDASAYRLKDHMLVNLLEVGLSNASLKVGMSYASRQEYALACTETSGSAEERSQFCSRFVAQIFHESNVEIVRNPDYCSLKDIEDSSKLCRINILREATKEEEEFALEKNTVIDQQDDSTSGFLEKVRVFSKRDIQTFDDVDKLLIDCPEYDEVVNDYLNDTTYLKLGDIEREKNFMMYSPETFLQTYGFDQCLKVSLQEHYQEKIRQVNFRNAIYKYEDLYHRTRCEYFKSHYECYRRQLELSLERFQVFSTILNMVEF